MDLLMITKTEVRETEDKQFRIIFYDNSDWSDAYKLNKQVMYELYRQLDLIVKQLEKE